MIWESIFGEYIKRQGKEYMEDKDKVIQETDKELKEAWKVIEKTDKFLKETSELLNRA